MTSPSDHVRLLRELQVHQAELETQNEELRRAQASLELARARYFDLYDLAPVGYCTLSEEGRILQSNLTFASLLGVPRGALEGRLAHQFVCPEDQDLYYLHRKQLLEGGEPRACELRLKKNDGSLIWVQLTSSLTRDGDGPSLERMVASDVNERKLLQLQSVGERDVLELLASGEPRTEMLGRLIKAYEAMIPGMRGSVLLLDASGEHLHYGVMPDLPKAWTDMIVGLRIGPEVGPCGMAAYTRASVIVEDMKTDPRWESYRSLALANGLHACWSLPILGTSRGSPATRVVLGALAFYFDAPRAAQPTELLLLERGARLTGLVLERDDVERALVESASMGRAVLDSMTSEIAVLDASGTILALNEPWHRFSRSNTREPGVPAPNTDVGANYLTIARASASVSENDGRAAAEGIQAVLDGRVPTFELEYPCHSPSEQRWFTMTVTPLAGGGTGVVVAHINITERKRGEAEKAALEAQLHQAIKMQSIGRLAGGVAHDFNNMLGVILGHCELATEQLEPGAPVLDDLEQIRLAARRSADLTNQLLAFARKQVVAAKVMNLNEAVQRMLAMLPRLIGEDIRVTWKPARDLWPICMDPTQIDQILTNLCINARDAITDVGTISVATDNCMWPGGVDSPPGDYVRLTVTDDGIGMSPEVTALVFEPFFTTKPLGQGTGLGLATVYGIVRQSQGFINVRSEPGKGTAFEIHFPRDAGGGTVPGKETLAKAGPHGAETILVVEDEPGLLALTSRILRTRGYKVLPAASPSEALMLVKDHAAEIRLLLTDVVMPEMNGHDLASAITALVPGIRCLFMSGYTADVIAPRRILGEGVHFIQKPFSRQVLATRVREVLDARPSPTAEE